MWQMVFVILLRRPWILCLLLLFYVVGLLVSLGPRNPEFWLGLAVLFVFPTAGIFAMVTERTVALCRSAGELAIPGHAMAANRLQVCTLMVVVGAPLLVSADGGNMLALATILCGAAAIGVLMANRPYLLVLVAVPAALLRDSGDWLANTYVQSALLIAALYVLARWFRLPRAAEADGAMRLAALAGSDHEATAETMADTFGVKPDDIDAHERLLDQAAATHGHSAGRRLTAADLCFALGFDCKLRVRSILIWAGLGCGVVLIWHFAHFSQPISMGYWFVTAFVAFALVTRASALYDAWRLSVGEQSLLRLAPSWPPPSAIKPLLAGAVASCLPGAWLTWLPVAVLAYGQGSVSLHQAAAGVAVIAAVSSAVASNLLLLMSRRILKAWHMSATLCLAVPASGALLIVLRQELAPIAIGMALLVGPVLVAIAVFSSRPLQFPVNVARPGDA